MNDSYYNTTSAQGPELKKYEGLARTQEDRIYQLFKIHSRMGPSKIGRLTSYPRTSIARSLRTLVMTGKLTKTENKVTGSYGRPEHVWQIRTGL